MSEQVLVERCQQNDNTARAELYRTFAPRLMAVCLRYAAHREEAEDMLHDAFLKIFATLGSFRWTGDGSLWVWMEKLTAHVAVDALRKGNLLSVVSYDDSTEAYTEPSTDDMACIPAEVLMQFISELPAGYRTVCNLFCMEQFTHKEIARMLNIKEKSSSSQLARAKSLLAARIQRYINEEL